MPRPGSPPLPNCIVRLLRRGSKGLATSIEVAEEPFQVCLYNLFSPFGLLCADSTAKPAFERSRQLLAELGTG